tara:strand:+ start:297 stop:578 length:282 start_codon:yes stop_codon:yes gene_type:complete
MESKDMNYQKDKLRFEEKKLIDQATEIEEQQKRIKELESKKMAKYREIKVTVVAMDNKEDDLQGWLYEAITAALVTTEGERITSFEIGQPFEK